MLITFLLIAGIALLGTTVVAMRYTVSTAEERLSQTLLSTALTLADDSRVVAVLETKTVDQALNRHLDYMISVSEDISVITVADNDSIRYFHPDKSRIGESFVGDDQYQVIETGETYIHDGIGTLGFQRRAFAPVFGGDGRQVGFVMVSAMMDDIDRIGGEIRSLFLAMGLLLLIAASLAAMAISNNIKGTLLGNEPAQMTRNFITREEVFASLEEGILSVDRAGKIILANRASAEMLNSDREQLVGQPIRSLLPSLTVDDVLESGRSAYNLPIQTPYSTMLCDKLPIRERQKVVGAVVLLRNKTEATRLAEQLTGSTHIITTLRAHTHEFMNHLHVILGLLQMDLKEDAMDYIRDIARIQTQEVSPVFQHIKNPTVAALILGKLSHLREQQIQFRLSVPDTLPEHSRFLSTRQQVTIIGNLLENATEAITASTDPSAPRQVELRMEESEAGLCISVMDTGIGLQTDDPEEIFRLGYSTKGPDRGTGMAMVREILEQRHGTIHVDSEPGDGTCVTVIVDRPRREPPAAREEGQL